MVSQLIINKRKVLLGAPTYEGLGCQSGCAGEGAGSKGYSSVGGCCPGSSRPRMLPRVFE